MSPEPPPPGSPGVDRSPAAGRSAGVGRSTGVDRSPGVGRGGRTVLACLAWLLLWHLTPGLLASGIGTLVSEDASIATLVECGVALIVLAMLLATHRRRNTVLFARSRLMWLYALPAVLALVLPLHYGLPLPVGVYIFWMTVSVLWQNYLTFGLLQSYLRDDLPAWLTIVVVTTMFWLGHVVALPDQFGPGNPLASLPIVAMGAVFALLRARLGTLHLLLVLHLTFYFIFA